MRAFRYAALVSVLLGGFSGIGCGGGGATEYTPTPEQAKQDAAFVAGQAPKAKPRLRKGRAPKPPMQLGPGVSTGVNND